MTNLKFQQELSYRHVVVDILTSLILIFGAWITHYIAEFLFAESVPLPCLLILYLRDLATVCWVVGTTAQYLKFGYGEVNKVVRSIVRSWMWKQNQKFMMDCTQNIYYIWLKSERVKLEWMSREISLLIMIIVISTMVFCFSYNLVDLILPPIYWSGIISLWHILPRCRWKNFKSTLSYWLVAFLCFTVLWLVSTSPPPYIGNSMDISDAMGIRNIISIDSLTETGYVQIESPVIYFRILILLAIGYLMLQLSIWRNRRKWIRTVQNGYLYCTKHFVCTVQYHIVNVIDSVPLNHRNPIPETKLLFV